MVIVYFKTTFQVIFLKAFKKHKIPHRNEVMAME
jgi:hypothetical protein